MFQSVTSWFTPKATPTATEGTEHTSGNAEVSTEMSANSSGGPMQLGSYLFGISKAATKTVINSAVEISATVNQKTIIGDFARQQDEFCKQQRLKKQRHDAAVPPWVGYVEEETMKNNILQLSLDKRNFVRNPPDAASFYFDMESMFPIALALLDIDENLRSMRFQLVPKQLKEDVFWRNYFYRVSLVKQNAQLKSLAAESITASPADLSNADSVEPVQVDVGGTSESDLEFVSDSYLVAPPAAADGAPDASDPRSSSQQSSPSDAASAHAALDNASKSSADATSEPWELELQRELADFELVEDDLDAPTDSAAALGDIEQEIENEISNERECRT